MQAGWATADGAAGRTVEVWGELDMLSGPALHNYFRRELARGDAFAIDASRVSFCDLHGLDALLAVARPGPATARRRLVTTPRCRVRRLLELTGTAAGFDVRVVDPASSARPGAA